MTIACVLRSGGDFDQSWVYALKAGVEEHLSHPTFVCLTDVEIEGVATIPLAHDWPGWWAKMEIFRPDLMFRSGPVLYADLDSLPVGSIDGFAQYGGAFAMINDFYQGRKRAQSGVMMLHPGEHTDAIWSEWIANPTGHMKRFRGDGEWLDRHTTPDRLQDIFPGQVVSLKVHAKQAPPENARLVCGHGRPRLSDPKAGWAHALWLSRAS